MGVFIHTHKEFSIFPGAQAAIDSRCTKIIIEAYHTGYWDNPRKEMESALADLNDKKTNKTGKTTTDNTLAEKDPVIQNELLIRLKKIEGQVRGVQKMIIESRDCGDIVTQLAAIKAAVNRVSITVLACHLADQIKTDLYENKDTKESLSDFMKVFKKFS